MATSNSLERYCKKYKQFLGVYSFDNLHNVFGKKLFPCDFFIYNSDSSKKDGTHWRMIMRIENDMLFCFDSLGRDSFKAQLPNSIQYNRSLLEYSNEENLLPTVNCFCINYNNIEYSSVIHNLHLKDSQEKWFTLFCKNYTQTHNLDTVNVAFNVQTYQDGESSLCGPWILYFLKLLLNADRVMNIDLDLVDAVLNTYFFDISYNVNMDVTINNLAPFFNFVKKDFWSYADITAQKLFLTDFQLFERQNVMETERIKWYMEKPTRESYPNYDYNAASTAKDNTLKEYFIHNLDLLKNTNPMFNAVSDAQLSQIPEVLEINSSERYKLDDRQKYIYSKMDVLMHLDQFWDVPFDQRNETKEIKTFIDNQTL